MKNKEYLRSAMFGCNDALVSTTGVIVGISAGTGNKNTIILAGAVTILVEALSMGSGQYISAKSARQYDGGKSKENPVISGVIMFIAYFMGGLVPLLPIFFLPVQQARFASIFAALVGLFVLGYYKGKVVKVSPIKSALEVFIIGAAATAIGLIVGNLLKV